MQQFLERTVIRDRTSGITLLLTATCLIVALSCPFQSSASESAAASVLLDAKIPSDIKSSGKLVLGTSASVGLPWSSTKEGTTDQFIGFDHDLAAAIAQRLGLTLEVSNIGFDSLIPSLQAKRVSIVISGMFDSAEREKKVDFVDYAIGGSAMLQKAGTANTPNAMDNLCGLKVSALRGSVEAQTAAGQSKKCTDAGKMPLIIQTFPDTNGQLAALSSGRTDVAFGDLEYMSLTAAKLPNQFTLIGDAFNAGPTGIAVEKDSTLGPVIVQILNTMIADGSYDKLCDKYDLPKMAHISKAVLDGATRNK
jgi:polar amino acid transport system substrate-binding protein